MSSIYIFNLAPQTTDEALRLNFAEFGTLRNIHVRRASNGLGRGEALIEYVEPAAADAAVLGMNTSQLDGRSIQVVPVDDDIVRDLEAAEPTQVQESAAHEPFAQGELGLVPLVDSAAVSTTSARRPDVPTAFHRDHRSSRLDLTRDQRATQMEPWFRVITTDSDDLVDVTLQ